MTRIGAAVPCFAFLLTGAAFGQSAAVGHLTTPRSEVTGVQLPSGKVLLAGGKRSDGTRTQPVAAAELYSLSRGSEAVAPMAQARFAHSLTVLSNGKVLAIGGSYADSAVRYAVAPILATAEVFDPASGKWRATGAMKHARSGHAAALLADSRVLVVGGHEEAELYTPSTGKFTVVGKVNEPRFNPELVKLQDGRVLVLGMGTSTDPLLARSAEIFDPQTRTFTLVGAMTTERTGRFTATLLQDGRVLVAGGDADQSRVGTYELFTPATGQFTFLGYMATDREGHTATLLQDGSVLIAGGYGCTNRTGIANNGGIVPPLYGPLAKLERFFPGAMAAQPAGTLLDGRYGHAAFILTDSLLSSVVVLGGEAGKGSLATVEAMPQR